MCVDGALQSGKSKAKESRAVCTPFSRLKNIRSSSDWSPRVFLHTVTRGVRFSRYGVRIILVRFLRRSNSLCGIFLFLKCIANTASITRIYDNLLNFKTSRLAVLLLLLLIEADPDQLMSEMTDL